MVLLPTMFYIKLKIELKILEVLAEITQIILQICVILFFLQLYEVGTSPTRYWRTTQIQQISFWAQAVT